MELNGTPGVEDGYCKTTNSSVSEAVRVNTTAINRKVQPRSTDVSLSRSSHQNQSCEVSQGHLDNTFQSRQLSVLSGECDNSLNASHSSLASSDVFTEEHCTNGIKRSASLPPLDTEGSLAMSRPSLTMPRSKSAISLKHYTNEMELILNGVNSTGKKSSSGGNSPIQSQRKISSNRRSSNACSRQRRRDSGFVSLFKASPTVSLRSENVFHYENQEKIIAYPRFYRAMYTYNSQDDGEVAFREGDEVEVIQRSENGWWLVRTPEKLGWGPSNFLQSLAY